jgi:uncharacterized repeat protein (TIGR02543 family)
MSSAKTVTFNWGTQYYLTVDNGGYGTAGGAGWYDANTNAQATITPLTVPGSAGTQYVFNGWSGDASGAGSPSDNILMDASKTATATWKTQYEVSFDVNPTGAGTTTPSETAWYDEGETVPISASDNSGYAFSSWSTTGSIDIAEQSSRDTTATINGPGTITANFAVSTQPTLITVKCDPSTVDKMGNEVTTISGTLNASGSGVSGKTITLYYKAGATGPLDPASGNGWIPINVTNTNGVGKYSYQWDPPEGLANGWYWIKADFAGDIDYYGSFDVTGSFASNLFVVPEYLIGALSALGTCFAAFITFKKRRPKHK